MRQKYGIDVLTIDVTSIDIREKSGADRFLDKVTEYLGK